MLQGQYLLQILTISLNLLLRNTLEGKYKELRAEHGRKEREGAGRDLRPLGEGVQGFLLQQLRDGGGPRFLQVVSDVAREARRGALALLLGVLPRVIWEES